MGIFLMVGAPAVGSYSSMNSAPLTLQIHKRNLWTGVRGGERGTVRLWVVDAF